MSKHAMLPMVAVAMLLFAGMEMIDLSVRMFQWSVESMVFLDTDDSME